MLVSALWTLLDFLFLDLCDRFLLAFLRLLLVTYLDDFLFKNQRELGIHLGDKCQQFSVYQLLLFQSCLELFDTFISCEFVKFVLFERHL